MGLFDKKNCDICGGKIGLLGNRKVDDGNICKDCNKKLSPWFTERKKSTVQSIKDQLAYRAENEEKLKSFSPTRMVGEDGERLYLDERQGLFCIAGWDYRKENADLLHLSQVLSCNYEIKEHRKDKTVDNREQTTYTYDFYVQIQVNSPWFQEIRYRVNPTEVEHLNSNQYRQALHECETVRSLLSGVSQQAMYPGYGGTPYPVPGTQAFGTQGVYPQQTGYMPQAGFTPQPPVGGQAQAVSAVPQVFRCAACGFEKMPEAGEVIRFCPACGTPQS